ncbi:hypothetical protein [Sutcliffiella sp. FSL R7-0096]
MAVFANFVAFSYKYTGRYFPYYRALFLDVFIKLLGIFRVSEQ